MSSFSRALQAEAKEKKISEELAFARTENDKLWTEKSELESKQEILDRHLGDAQAEAEGLRLTTLKLNEGEC